VATATGGRLTVHCDSSNLGRCRQHSLATLIAVVDVGRVKSSELVPSRIEEKLWSTILYQKGLARNWNKHPSLGTPSSMEQSSAEVQHVT
jgi:hypothetical protein